MTTEEADFTVYDLTAQGHYYYLIVQDRLSLLTVQSHHFLPSDMLFLLLKCLLRAVRC